MYVQSLFLTNGISVANHVLVVCVTGTILSHHFLRSLIPLVQVEIDSYLRTVPPTKKEAVICGYFQEETFPKALGLRAC